MRAAPADPHEGLPRAPRRAGPATDWFSHAEGGRSERGTFCPGSGCGLAFCGWFAVIDLSKPCENRTFTGLPLNHELLARAAEERCGLMVVRLRTSDPVHWLRIEGVIEELYDCHAAPRAAAAGDRPQNQQDSPAAQ